MRAAAVIAIWIASHALKQWVQANPTPARQIVGAFGHLLLALAAVIVLVNSLLAILKIWG